MTIRVLTPTEARVARLVAGGRTNPEMAEDLGLTRKTVEWHLSRVHRKLGTRSRAELAGLLLEGRRDVSTVQPLRRRLTGEATPVSNHLRRIG